MVLMLFSLCSGRVDMVLILFSLFLLTLSLSPHPLSLQDEWDHSSNGSTGSRPSSGSRPGSGSRSGSRGRNNQFRGPAKVQNGNREGSFDILGTDIWAANTMDSHGGATWDLQPEKLDFSQFHRKPFRGAPKHLPHIDREG
uniref:Uncharacterized protein n=1 Tax=Hucho hucho TaxID=62062 RepID=A0A4W5QQ21_9TELE